MWQALETKARFIAQVMTGDNAVRRAEDIGGQELSYAEVKAIASGNPAVLTLAEADAELQRLTLLKKNHADEQYLARRSLRELPETIASAVAAPGRPHGRHGHRRRLMPTIPSPSATAPSAREDAIGVLGARLDALPQYVRQSRRVPLGIYRGLRFGLVLASAIRPRGVSGRARSRAAARSRANTTGRGPS